ncbi:MAG: glucokinase, partial [Deltaproteobacteria bacterium]|nr:glucokinase [Deltaproteobacteria bacterium]
MRLLAGDIGGTKALLAVYEGEAGALTEVQKERIPSNDHESAEALVAAFIERGTSKGPIDNACFAVAGPVADDRCQATNLPWLIDARALEKHLGIPAVTLLNDFAAIAHGVVHLEADQRVVLADLPVDPTGPIAILGAGTGLGEAILVPTPDGPRVLASEGGHADFGPRDELEVSLLRFLLERHDRVSVERVVSGLALTLIYEFVVTRHLAPEDSAVRHRMKVEDPGKVIGSLALEAQSPDGGQAGDAACVRTMEIFVSLYGSEAGNLALKVVPTGGLYVAGGIATKIVPLLEDGRFMTAFRSKDRMAKLLETIRVTVVTEPEVGLLGA